MNIKILIATILFLFALPLLAQEDGTDEEYLFENETVVDDADSIVGPNLHILARSYGDSVVLRWGATTYTAWQTAGRGGYVLERLELTDNMPEKPQWKRLNTAPIRPLTIDEWKAQYRPEDTLAGAAVQTLYGASVVTESDPFGAIYETYLQQQNMHSFAMVLADIAPRLADGYGLRFVDRNVKPYSTYLYRLYSLANDPNEPIDTATIAIGVADPQPTPNIESLTVAEQEKVVVLKWYRYEHSNPFTGYFIERSTDGGRTFSRLKSIPFIPANNIEIDDDSEGNFDTIEYKIALERNYDPVTYRIVGVDAFGDVSPAGAQVVAMGRDLTAPKAPLIVLPEVVDGNGILIRWSLPPEMDGDLDGFFVGRAGNTEGPFEAISDFLPITTRDYVHRGVDTLPPGYYVVSAVDTAGNLRNSMAVLGILPDSIPPMVPTGVTGFIDSNGVVTVTWTPNEEDDLQGYRVFFANQTNHEFQQLTTDITTDTIFRDTLTLKTLSEEVYYKITALDQNFNHSKFTDVLTLKKPDIVAPVPPVIVSVEPGEQGVLIEWYRSPSGDALNHTLYRRAADATEWETLYTTAEKDGSEYRDSLAERGKLYEYALDVIDDDGNRSQLSNIITARPYDSGLRPGVDELACTYDSAAGGVVVRWNYRFGKDAQVYLYKASPEGAFGLVASMDASAGEYLDREVFAGSRYLYSLKVVSNDGGESIPVRSEEVVVR